jgi:amino acid transporter
MPNKVIVGAAVGPSRLLGFALGLVVVFLLYRRVTTLGRWSIVFSLGVIAILGWVLIEGTFRFNSRTAFDMAIAPDEWPPNFGLALGMGMGLAIYAYFGYYNVCYLGDEVVDPARTIPRSILFSALAVVVLFTLVHLAIVGVVPWREAKLSTNLAADFMARIRGPWAANAVTLCLIASSFASSFSGTLGYSRVPFAAARNGHFFRWFAEIHPEHQMPHRSLLLVGGLILFWSFFSLEAIITALIATRILEQFVAQAIGIVLLRNLQPQRPRPWRMWLYPLPCIVAIGGWLFVYAGTGLLFILIGAATLMVGLGVFILWANRQREWPFGGSSGAERSN